MPGKLYINRFEICECTNNCGCAGGGHSYIDDYINVLNIFKPETVMEWGPGPNTYLALGSGVNVVYSIEQKKKWVIRTDVPGQSCEVIPVDSDEYVRHPKWRIIWDLYFIDSRRRQECLSLAYNQGVFESIVCIHDAQRPRYQKYIRQFDYVIFLSRGFCVASRSRILLNLKVKYPFICEKV